VSGRLDGRVALITGAAFGIGRAIAHEFVRDGASVFLTDINEAGLRETAEQIATDIRPRAADTLPANLRRPEMAADLVAACVARFGRLDCLVNNAADQSVVRLENVTDAHWDALMDVNLKAILRLAQAALPHLSERPGAAIVNLSSLVGELALPGRIAYDTSKTAILGITRALAVELGPRGIRANAILPGHIMSVGEEEWKRRHSERNQRILSTSYALLRVGKPEEVARVAVFLASDDASFITGQSIFVDGGMSILCPEEAVFRAAALFSEGPATATPGEWIKETG
jgi:NAD(P)-dependent dehydrogenase (short-subunit alcohol dehydrogenase family)